MQTHNSNDETPRKNDKDTTKKNNSDVNIEQNQTQQKKSRKLTQITNWNLKIISKLSELKNIEKGLLSNTLVKACQGQYDHSNNTSNPSLHMIIKFVKQMSKLFKYSHFLNIFGLQRKKKRKVNKMYNQVLLKYFF